MKLFIDDIRKCPEGWIVARTVTEAIRLLDLNIVDEVSLDHDICHYNIHSFKTTSCPETFEPVARFIAKAYQPYSLRVIIHTANPDGGRKLLYILTDFRPEVIMYSEEFYENQERS